MLQLQNGVLVSYERHIDTYYKLMIMKHYAKREESDTHGHILFDSIYLKYAIISSSKEIESRLVIDRERWKGNRELKGHRVSLRNTGNVLKLHCGNSSVDEEIIHGLWMSKGWIFWFVNCA